MMPTPKLSDGSSKDRLNTMMDAVIKEATASGDIATLTDRVVANFAAEIERIADPDLIWALFPERTREFVIRGLFEERRPYATKAKYRTTEWPGKFQPVHQHPTTDQIRRQPAQDDRLSRSVEARLMVEKAVLNKVFVNEIGLPFGECTLGDIRAARDSNRRKGRFYDLVLSGRDALPDATPTLGTISSDELKQCLEMSKFDQEPTSEPAGSNESAGAVA